MLHLPFSWTSTSRLILLPPPDISPCRCAPEAFTLPYALVLSLSLEPSFSSSYLSSSLSGIKFETDLKTGAMYYRRKAKWLSITELNVDVYQDRGSLLLCTTCCLKEITSLSLPLVMYHTTTHVLEASTAFGCCLRQAGRQSDRQVRVMERQTGTHTHTHIVSSVIHIK